ncbi:MAG: alternate-type signal peptide domain-containing protein [Propionibacteriaceae bacterium]|jgi:alternate signal-mediated exported protein|nr:alternate-type signal peptide domain-containing protein [Propionibacteriaceae bacterium]
MNITPHNETDRRSRRVKGLIAGVAGIALLLGGSTFAYWSQTANTVNPGTLNNGNLNIEALSSDTVKVFDINHNGTSTTVVGTANATDITSTATGDNPSYRYVPGDQIEIDLSATITLAGDNMQADLYLKPAAEMTGLKGWSFTVKVYDTTSTVAQIGSGEVSLSSINPDQALNGSTPLTKEHSGQKITVALVGTLDPTLGDGTGTAICSSTSTRDCVTESLDLSSLGLTLQQRTNPVPTQIP